MRETGTDDRIRLSLPKELKIYMEKEGMEHRTNQKFHGLPYNKLYIMLEYKLKMYGIRLEKQKESYSSQCSPVSPEVSKKYAEPSNRKKRGLYVAGKKETAVA